jgi:hypothetical protein
MAMINEPHMHDPREGLTTAVQVREYLGNLQAERTQALGAGLGDNRAYMADLDSEIAMAREAYVGMAVTEMATLRGELFGRQVG